MSDLCLVNFLLYVFDLIMGRLEGGTNNCIPTSNAETLGKTSEIHLHSLKKGETRSNSRTKDVKRYNLYHINQRNFVKLLKFNYFQVLWT